MDSVTLIKELGTAGILALFLWQFLKQYERSLSLLEQIVKQTAEDTRIHHNYTTRSISTLEKRINKFAIAFSTIKSDCIKHQELFDKLQQHEGKKAPKETQEKDKENPDTIS